ncbi:MAG: D-alanyl-D-alanine carboxypeptidase [Microthrixaceae bacterium]
MTDPPGADTGAGVVRRSRNGPRRTRLGWLALGLLVLGAALAASGWVLGSPAQQDAGATESPGPEPAAAPLLSARRVPSFTTARVPVRAMAAAVQPVALDAPPQSCIVVGSGTGDLFTHRSGEALVPASNQKLLTAAAALDVLGPDATLETRFVAPGRLEGGVLRGDLFMVGGGDPLLTTEGYQARQSNGRFPDTDLEAVADDLVESGIAEITGSVVGDASRYDQERAVQGWPARWTQNGTVAPLSALLVNDAWLVDPVTGEGPGGPAPDPAQHAAAVMERLLRDRGVRIGGAARSGTAPSEATELAAIDSLPVTGLVGELLAFSDNTTAELLLKEIGLEASGAGTTEAGIAAITSWAEDSGIAEPGWAVADGSGLSSSNRLTCTMLATVLREDGPEGPIAAGLAVPGSPGTLDDRFLRGDMSERLRAKTGTLNEVAALSGWVLTAREQLLDFEFLINTDQRRVNGDDLALQQRLLAALLDQPVAPPVQEAGPGGSAGG